MLTRTRDLAIIAATVAGFATIALAPYVVALADAAKVIGHA